ncbi:hypothetical protein [Actinomadura sp. 9N407]|uniref:hypothetical protein n=1 Tax=Actinomadura sp. 9N407 TaxID=3375154 RepID=UPI00379F9749
MQVEAHVAGVAVLVGATSRVAANAIKAWYPIKPLCYRCKRRPEQLSSAECEELKRLRKENSELKRANEILKAAIALFAAELGQPRTM